MSVGYLALTRQTQDAAEILSQHNSSWRSWYDYFPWEDWRDGRPVLLDTEILPRLELWAMEPPTEGDPPRALSRQERVNLSFGIGSSDWDEERALERFELLYEAGLVREALRDGRPAASPVINYRDLAYPCVSIIAGCWPQQSRDCGEN